MKSQRLLEILLLLQARSPRPAPELAAVLRVTERTIYRDVEALSVAGVPVFTVRGSRGGIGLLEGYRRAVPQLAENEIRALFVNGEDPLADLGFGDMLSAAREKLFGALSNRQRTWAATAGGRIRIEQRAWGQAPQPKETLAKLRLAVWDERTVEAVYRDQQGRVSFRTLDPLGLVFKAGAWYVVARTKVQIRTYRAERILSIDVLADRFTRPKDFHLDEYWEQSSRRYEAKAAPCAVRVSGNLRDLERLAVFWPLRIIDAPTTANPIAEVVFPIRGLAVRELLVWSADIEVLMPVDIRDEITARLALAQTRYRSIG